MACITQAVLGEMAATVPRPRALKCQSTCTVAAIHSQTHMKLHKRATIVEAFHVKSAKRAKSKLIRGHASNTDNVLKRGWRQPRLCQCLLSEEVESLHGCRNLSPAHWWPYPRNTFANGSLAGYDEYRMCFLNIMVAKLRTNNQETL